MVPSHCTEADLAALLDHSEAKYQRWLKRKGVPERDRRLNDLNPQNLQTAGRTHAYSEIYEDFLGRSARQRIKFYNRTASAAGCLEMFAAPRIETFRQLIMATVENGSKDLNERISRYLNSVGDLSPTLLQALLDQKLYDQLRSRILDIVNAELGVLEAEGKAALPALTPVEKAGPNRVAGIIGKLPKDAFFRIEAATAAFMAEFVPKMEREANKRGPVHDAELLRELVIHQFNLVARECMAVCVSVEEFEAELRSDIARFARYGLSQYPWLAEPMRQELDRGFALFVMGANPWAKIPEQDRASVWHVGAITGEALSHAALKLRAEGWKHVAEGGFSKANQTGAKEPSGDESTHNDAGPAANRTNPAKSDGKGRKRGPKPDHEAASLVADIVAREAPDGDWRSKLDVVCEALDTAEVPYPSRWRKRDKSCDGWAAYDEKANAVKAIEYRLEIAKQGKKVALETLS
jgi:hypothetical protein